MRRCVPGFTVGLALAACATVAAARSTTLAYAVPSFGLADGYVVDWNDDGTAWLSDLSGAGGGTYTDDGTQRLLTLTTPISMIYDNYDCNGNQF